MSIFEIGFAYQKFLAYLETKQMTLKCFRVKMYRDMHHHMHKYSHAFTFTQRGI